MMLLCHFCQDATYNSVAGLQSTTFDASSFLKKGGLLVIQSINA